MTAYYIKTVANGGSDSANGLTLGTAFATFTRATSVAVNAGDVVNVDDGTYTEQWRPQFGGSAGNPITFRALNGNGTRGARLVNLRWSGATAFDGVIYIAGLNNTGYVGRLVNDLTFNGFDISGGTGARFFVCYKGSDSGSSKRLTFSNCDFHGNQLGLHVESLGLKILDCWFYRQSQSGAWIFAGSDGFEIRRTDFQDSYPGTGNCDALTVQDVNGFLIEDCQFFASTPVAGTWEYDGLDLGSQASSPGCSFGIVRRCKMYSNSNGNAPCSTAITGPICYQYCVQNDNFNWASNPYYEFSTNGHWWNCVFYNVGNCINFQQPAASGIIRLRNSIFSCNTVVEGGSGATANIDYCRKIQGAYSTGATVVDGGHNTLGAVNFVAPGPSGSSPDALAGTRDFHITSNNAALIDQGTFMMLTTSSTTSATVPVNGDPRTYFWPGDTIQIEGPGLVVVSSLTSSTIVLTAPATFTTGKGVHLPWNGTGPDIGAFEFATTGTTQVVNVPAAALTLTKAAPQVMPIMIPRAQLSLSAKVPTVGSIGGVLGNIFNAGRGVLHPIFAGTTPPTMGNGASRVGFSGRVAAASSYFSAVSGISSVSAAQSSNVVVQNFSVTCASRFGIRSRNTVFSTQTGGPTAVITSGRSSFGLSSSLIAYGQVDQADTDTASSFGVSSSNTVRGHGTLVWDRIVSPGGIWQRIDPP